VKRRINFSRDFLGMTNDIAEKLQSMNGTVEQLSDSSQHVSAAVTDHAEDILEAFFRAVRYGKS
jgi:methyl-accepting chemotaxis protein